MMSSILLTIAAMCDGSTYSAASCQRQYIQCVRDKMMQTPGGKSRPDDLLWECAVEAADRK